MIYKPSGSVKRILLYILVVSVLFISCKEKQNRMDISSADPDTILNLYNRGDCESAIELGSRYLKTNPRESAEVLQVRSLRFLSFIRLGDGQAADREFDLLVRAGNETATHFLSLEQIDLFLPVQYVSDVSDPPGILKQYLAFLEYQTEKNLEHNMVSRINEAVVAIRGTCSGYPWFQGELENGFLTLIRHLQDLLKNNAPRGGIQNKVDT